MAFVYFGIPTHSGRVSVDFVTSLIHSMNMLVGTGHYAGVRFRSGNSILYQCRNELLADFMAVQDATHLLMIDDDIAWEPNDVLRLLEHDVPVVAAAGPHKATRPAFCFRSDTTERNEVGLVSVAGIGTGFMMIRKDAVQAMQAAYTETEYRVEKCEPGQRFFNLFGEMYERHDGYDLPLLLGEDFAFCRRWRDMDGQVFMDPDIALDHRGEQVYSGRPVDAMEVLQPAWTQERCRQARTRKAVRGDE